MSNQTASVKIVPIERPSEIRAFVDFGFRLNERYPAFVTQLRMDILGILDKSKNPFWQRAEYQLFLAYRDGKIVGKIAAIDNHAHNEIHQENLGHWGFFDSIDDVEVAKALFAAIEEWHRKRGRSAVLGPTNPSTNDEIGFLLDSYDQPAVLMMTWNPEYYLNLTEACGYTKAKDLYAWWMSPSAQSDRYKKGADLLRKRLKVEIRHLDMKNFWNEVTLIKDVYNQAWAKNWGFFPMTDAEIDHLAKQLKPIVDPEFCTFAFVDGKLVAFSLALPDFYQALKGIKGGKLFPFGVFKLVWNLFVVKKINRVRLLVMGVVPEFRNRGIDVVLYDEAVKACAKRNYTGGELSWILEDNTMMNTILGNIGAKIYRNYRLYQKALS